MLKKIINWFFSEKLNFQKEFLLNPISENTKTTFFGLNNEQVEFYFNYHKAPLLIRALDGIGNRFTYKDVLNSVIDRMEEKYTTLGIKGINNFFDYVGEELLVEKGFEHPFDYRRVFRTILINLEPICKYLGRMPVPELVEDIQVLNQKGKLELIEKKKIKSELIEKKALEHENKIIFLEGLIYELEKAKVARQEIINILPDKFLEHFSIKVDHIVRTNGIWTIKFDNKTVNIVSRVQT